MFGLSYLKLIGIGVILVIGASGAWWIQGLRLDKANAKIALQETAIQQQADLIEYYQKAAKIDVDTAKEKEVFHEIIKSGDPQRLLNYFKRMRDLSTAPSESDN